jgi:hypothetical protein
MSKIKHERIHITHPQRSGCRSPYAHQQFLQAVVYIENRRNGNLIRCWPYVRDGKMISGVPGRFIGVFIMKGGENRYRMLSYPGRKLDDATMIMKKI